MELRELEVGKRFVFEDDRTSLPLAGKETGSYYPPKGIFKLLGVSQWGWGKLLHEDTGKEIVVVVGVHLRHVLPIL